MLKPAQNARRTDMLIAIHDFASSLNAAGALFRGEAKSPDAAVPAAPAPARLNEAAEAWDRTKDTTNIAVLEAFIVRYKDTYYADLARLQALLTFVSLGHGVDLFVRYARRQGLNVTLDGRSIPAVRSRG